MWISFLLALAILSVTVCGKVVPTTNIENVVVLMLENRSFDHMLGYTKKQRPEINGCLEDDATCANQLRPGDATSPFIPVNPDAVYSELSPHHSIHDTTIQIFGADDDTLVPNMSGFVLNYEDALHGDQVNAAHVMDCFSPDHVPVMTTIAENFAVFNNWYSALPGPTMPNRAFAVAATSDGMGTNDPKRIAMGLPNPTIFGQLSDMGLDYKVYFELIPATLMFKELRRDGMRKHFFGMKQFYNDASNGTLANFTWLEPRYYSTPKFGADDQHPDHNVALGETLIKNVYEAVRNSPQWNTTALIITYDEHGGFYDHVVPPSTNVPNPDGKNSVDDPFTFDRLGVRVPTIVVSPWVEKGAIINGPAEGEAQFDHTSTIKTVVHKLFKVTEDTPEPEYLSKRDAWAASYENIFTNLSAPRTDCPTTLPEIVDATPFMSKKHGLDGSGAMTDLQLELLAIAAGVVDDKTLDLGEAEKTWTEAEGAKYVAGAMNKFFGRTIVPNELVM